MWATIALSFGLAMDATAVSAARGLAGHPKREAFALAAFFGGFQSAMAGLGWAANAFAREYISAYDHWIAGGVLLVIGGKMIVDGLRAGPEELPAGTLAVYL